MFFFNRQININNFFPENFVDIHSHLLPEIDDGAKSINDSLEMIQKLSSFGIKKIITTPHVLGEVYPNNPDKINKKLVDVKTCLKRNELAKINISAAAEYMLDEKFESILNNNDILFLKDNYLLVEMSYFSPPLNLYELLFKIRLKNYKPVLAHPERYVFFHNNIENFYKLKNSGCLFQLNLLSLSSYYGKNIQKIAKILLNEGLYDFVGTDAHNMRHIDELSKISNRKNLRNIETLMQNNIKIFS